MRAPACLPSVCVCVHALPCTHPTVCLRHRSPGAANLRHSATALLYLLPPYAPMAKLDLINMCVLGEHVPLLPIILMPDAVSSAASEEAAAYQNITAAMLTKPRLAGLKLPAANLFRCCVCELYLAHCSPRTCSATASCQLQAQSCTYIQCVRTMTRANSAAPPVLTGCCFAQLHRRQDAAAAAEPQRRRRRD